MTLIAKQLTILTLAADVNPEKKAEFVEWQGKFNATIAGYPDFVSLEFTTPSEKQKNWLIVQRFGNENAVASWNDSKEYHELLDELQSVVADDGIKQTMTDASSLKGNVTEVFVTEVNPEMVKDYNKWIAKIHQVEAKFPGFKGTYVQSPKHDKGKQWITLLQFDNLENLDKWLESKERQDLLKESVTMISSLETHRVISPYAGWFASIAKTSEMPPLWKQTMVILLVLYPIVMLELKYLSPLTKGLDLSWATFIGNALSVTLISFPMMPMAIRSLHWWLSPASQKMTIVGTILMLFLYFIEVVLFWKFV